MAGFGGYPTYNSGFGPMQSFMMPQMAAQSPMPPQQSVPQGVQGLSPASRPVSNKDEANAVPADFSGTLMVFPDVKNGRIYLKRWNYQTGAADFMEFAPVQPAQVADSSDKNFVPKDLFQAEINSLRAEIEALKKPAGRSVKSNDADK